MTKEGADEKQHPQEDGDVGGGKGAAAMAAVQDRMKHQVESLQHNLKKLGEKETYEMVADRTKSAVKRRVRFYAEGVDEKGNKVAPVQRALKAREDLALPVCSGSVGVLPRVVALGFVGLMSVALCSYLIGALLFNVGWWGFTALWILHVILALAACHVITCFCCQTMVNTWWCHASGTLSFACCGGFALCPFCWWMFVWLISLPVCSEDLGGAVITGCVGLSILTWATLLGCLAMSVGCITLMCFLGLSIIDVIRTVKIQVKKELLVNDANVRLAEEQAWADATIDYTPPEGNLNDEDIEAQWRGDNAVQMTVLSSSGSPVVDATQSVAGSAIPKKKKNKNKNKIKKNLTPQTAEVPLPVDDTSASLPGLAQPLSASSDGSAAFIVKKKVVPQSQQVSFTDFDAYGPYDDQSEGLPATSQDPHASNDTNFRAEEFISPSADDTSIAPYQSDSFDPYGDDMHEI